CSSKRHGCSERRRRELRGRRERLSRAADRSWILEKLCTTDSRRGLLVQWLEVQTWRGNVRNSAHGRIQCAQRGDGSDGSAILRCTENKGRQRIQALFRHRAATRSARGSARGESYRRFRPSSNRYRAYDAGASSSLPRPSHLGSFRATLQHNTARGFSTATFRRFESGGRGFFFPRCRPGANPGKRRSKI